MMKMITALTLLIFSLSFSLAIAEPLKKDPVEKGFKDAFEEYQKENYSTTVEKLREMIKLLEEKNVQRVGEVLPEKIDDWHGTDLKREDLSALGGGVSVKRVYNDKSKSITVKLVKDSPLIDKWIGMLSNRDLLQASGKKVHNISGEAALVDKPLKVLMAIDEEILVEIKGDNDCSTKDLIALTRKLDLRKMKKMD